MILFDNKLEADIIDWIKTKLQSNGKECVIINIYDRKIEDLLLAYICSKLGLETIALTHDPNIYNLNIKNIIPFNKLDILRMINQDLSTKKCKNDNIVYLYLESIAEENNGLIVGSYTRANLLYTRCYSNLDNITVFPFGNFSEMNIFDFYNNICYNNKYLMDAYFKYNMNDKICDIITHRDLDWIHNINEKTKLVLNNEGIIISDNDPTKYKNWFSFTSVQKEIIAKIHNIEKSTRNRKKQNFSSLNID